MTVATCDRAAMSYRSRSRNHERQLILVLSCCAFVATACDRRAPLTEMEPELIRVLGTDSITLFNIRGAAFKGSSLVILTAPEPSIHFFTNDRLISWGAKGAGPAELENPRDILSIDDHLLVLDRGLGKIVSYDSTGELFATRTYAPLPVGRLRTSGNDTLLGLFTYPTDRGPVIRMSSRVRDTILTLPAAGPRITLQVEDSPSDRKSVV